MYAVISLWPLWLIVVLFVCTAIVIGWFGVQMTEVARDLAHASGLGEAVMGALFIGAATSLSGITTSVVAASEGFPELAISNALGGIAAQTAFLAIADIVYRRANLEHAAASAENLFMTGLLITLLSIHLLGLAVPELEIFSIHPASILLLLAYILGIRLLAQTHEAPMWLPKRTSDTNTEQQTLPGKLSKGLPMMWLKFAGYALVVGAAGWSLAQLAFPLAERTGLSQGIVGGVFTAVATSIPELVVAVSAVRLGALNLAVGDIIGGNAFDTLFIAASDLAYRAGPIYNAVSQAELFWLANSLLMAGVLLLGLIYRERHGPANIGLESLIILVLYVAGLVTLSVAV
jgi:cation:H+ antiporter